MVRIRLFYFYESGAALGALNSIRPGVKLGDVNYQLFQAETVLRGLLEQNLLSLESSRPFAQKLLAAIQVVQLGELSNRDLQMLEVFQLQSELTQFNTAFNAESSVADTYVVTSKRGFKTNTLIQVRRSPVPY